MRPSGGWPKRIRCIWGYCNGSKQGEAKTIGLFKQFPFVMGQWTFKHLGQTGIGKPCPVEKHEPKSHWVPRLLEKAEQEMTSNGTGHTAGFKMWMDIPGLIVLQNVPPSCVNGRGKAPASPESALAQSPRHHVKVVQS